MKILTLSLILVLAPFMLFTLTPEKNQDKSNNSITEPAMMTSFLPFVSVQNPQQVTGPKREIYKTIGDVKVYLYILTPPNHKSGDKLPAFVWFHGGGMKANPTAEPSLFQHQCGYLVSRGMVAIDVQYRGLPDFTRSNCISDAQSAVRWVRANAKRLGIDPERITASGGSAGGYLALSCTATIAAPSENGEDTTISCKPNALVLFNPGVSNQYIRPSLPPTIILHGTNDKLVPYATIEKFTLAMKEAGNRCELFGFEGAGHSFFIWNDSNNADSLKFYVETLRDTDRFLASLGWIKGEPMIDHYDLKK